jgi:hypothetical protein
MAYRHSASLIKKNYVISSKTMQRLRSSIPSTNLEESHLEQVVRLSDALREQHEPSSPNAWDRPISQYYLRGRQVPGES